MPLSSWLSGEPPCVLRTVIVTPKSDQASAIKGVLWQYRRRWLVLREPVLLRPATPPTPLDGELVMHRDNVAYLQVVT